MNYLDEIKKDVLRRILIAKRNSKISDANLISLLNERIDENSTHLHRNIVYDWKISKSASFMDYIDDIAEFTKTSVDYLIGRKNSELPLDTAAQQEYDVYDKQLLSLFRELNEEGRRTAINLVGALTKQGDFKKSRPDEPETKNA